MAKSERFSFGEISPYEEEWHQYEKAQKEWVEQVPRVVRDEYRGKLRMTRARGEREIMEKAKEKAKEETVKLWAESPQKILAELMGKYRTSLPLFIVEENDGEFSVLYGLGSRIFPSYFYDSYRNFYRKTSNAGYLGDAMWAVAEIERSPSIEDVLFGLDEAVANDEKANQLILSRGFYVFSYFVLDLTEKEHPSKVIQVIKADSLEEAAKKLPSDIDTEGKVIVSFAEKARHNRDLLETVTQEYDVQTGSLLPPISYQTPKLL